MRLAAAIWMDLRQAVRRIVRTPWVSIVVVGTLALAIAANTTIFSLMKMTVLRKLPVPDPDALVSLEGSDTRTNTYSAIFLPTFRILKEQPGALVSLAAYLTSAVRVESGGVNVMIGVEGVTPEYFSVLDVQPHSGRLLSVTDDPLAPIGVVSERFALRLFGSTDVAGRTVTVDGRQVELIGVTEKGFAGIRIDGGDDLFLSLAFLRYLTTGDAKAVPRAQHIIGRLAPGATVEAARAGLRSQWPSLKQAVAAELPPAQRQFVENQQLVVDSFARGFSITRNTYGRSLWLAMAVASALLCVGCINLSALMLARALTRQHEFAVRRALGVSRLRLLQQSAIDGVLLSVVAAVVAVPLAWWAGGMLVRTMSVARAVPMVHAGSDWQVILLATIVSMVAGVAISGLPARRASSIDMEDVLRGRGTAHRIRGAARVIVGVQAASSMMLVVGGGLFAATVSNLYANDLQQRDYDVIWTRLARNPLERRTQLPLSYFQQLSERLRSIPGADAAAHSVMYPAYLNVSNSIPRDTVVTASGATLSAVNDSVSPGFFELYSIALLRGRDVTWFDTADAPAVAIVNETLARQLAASGEVIGQQLKVLSPTSAATVEIVGVVADANVTHIRDGRAPAIYRPLGQDLARAQSPLTHVRVRGDLAAMQRAYVDVVNEQRHHTVLALITMNSWIDHAVVEQRLLASMSGFAAALAVALSAVGLFGLLAYSVSSRTREIAVRVSLGAAERDVVRMIIREGVFAALPGVALGIPLALGGAWLLRSLFYGVGVTDLRPVSIAAAMLIATTLVASWLPARRAARIQPGEALRQY